MKLRELREQYDLHDSLVEGIDYLPEQKKVVVYSEHYNWASWDDGELVAEELVFTNVSRYEIVASTSLFDGDEIVTANVFLKDGRETMKIILLEESGEIKEVYIEAEQVEWQSAQKK